MRLTAIFSAAAVAATATDLSAPFYCSEGPNQAATPLEGTTDSPIPLWPTTVPGEHPGAIGAEYENCLTKGVSVPDCKDKGVHNVTVPTLTPFLVSR